MSLYTLKHLLHDCSSRMSRTKGATDKKRETLADVWRALNDWIDSRFDVGKGVHIATFATISWETCTNARNQARVRPSFLLSETFIKTYGLTNKKPLTPPQLASLEDINFTKIAIKYSKTLTKDLVFCGIRDMLQKIGEVAGTGAPLSIAFNVGRLIAKDRCVSMIFDPLKFPRSLEDQITRSMIGTPPSVLGNLSDFDIAPEDHVDYAGVATAPPLMDSLQPQQQQYTFETDDQEALPTHRSNPENVIPGDVGSLLEQELELFGIRGSPAKDNPVIESAYRRHLSKLAGDVELEAKYAFDLQLQQKRDLDTVALETKLRRQCAEDMQRHIRSQMEERRVEKVHERNQLKHLDPSVSSFYSDGEQTRLGYDDKDFVRRTKEDLKRQLQEQMHQKEQERADHRHRSLQDDQSFLRRLRHEMAEIEDKQTQQREERRRVLTDAWNRDSAVKKLVELKKRQRAAEAIQQEGIALSPVRGNYYPHLPQPRTPRRVHDDTCDGGGVSEGDDFSVGFDIRSVC